MTTHPVTIENDAIRMDVWPTLGGKVSSIVDKADKFELLFNYPSEIPTEALYDIPYQSGWYGGWDECFPAVAPGPYTGHPYNAINVPDHGELWGIPTVAVPTKDGITTVWNGLRFGYRLTRKLSLDGPSLEARYTLVNLAPFPFRFVWAQHALMSMASQKAELRLPAGAAMRLSHDANGRTLDQDFSWPTSSAGEDFSRPGELPEQRGWKMFSAEPVGAGSPAVIVYPGRSRTLEIGYTSDDGVAAYWGLWIDTGGWARHHHFALEPTTGRFDQIDRAIKDNSAGRAGPSAQVSWTVTWRLK